MTQRPTYSRLMELPDSVIDASHLAAWLLGLLITLPAYNAGAWWAIPALFALTAGFWIPFLDAQEARRHIAQMAGRLSTLQPAYDELVKQHNALIEEAIAAGVVRPEPEPTAKEAAQRVSRMLDDMCSGDFR